MNKTIFVCLRSLLLIAAVVGCKSASVITPPLPPLIPKEKEEKDIDGGDAVEDILGPIMDGTPSKRRKKKDDDTDGGTPDELDILRK